LTAISSFSQVSQDSTKIDSTKVPNWTIVEANKCFTEIGGVYEELDSTRSLVASYNRENENLRKEVQKGKEALNIYDREVIPYMNSVQSKTKKISESYRKQLNKTKVGLGISLPLTLGVGIVVGFLIAYR